MACADVKVVDDGLAEGNESFSVMLQRSNSLDPRINLSSSVAKLIVVDNDGKCVSKCFKKLCSN